MFLLFGISCRGILGPELPYSADGTSKLRVLKSRTPSSRLPSTKVEYVFERWISRPPTSIGFHRHGLLNGSVSEGFSRQGLPRRDVSRSRLLESRDSRVEKYRVETSRWLSKGRSLKLRRRQGKCSSVKCLQWTIQLMERCRLESPSVAIDSRVFD